MLSKRERLSRASLSRPRGFSGRFAFGSFRLTSAPAPQGAVVAPKKVFKTAIIRNSVRRKTLAALRILIREGRVHEGIIVYPSKEAITTPAGAILEALRTALKDAPAR